MRQHIKDVLALEVIDQLIEVAPQRLDLLMLRLGYSQRQHVQLDVLIGEIGGDLFADEKIVVMGQRQGAVDGVVVGEGDIGHATGLGRSYRRSSGSVLLSPTPAWRRIHRSDSLE